MFPPRMTSLQKSADAAGGAFGFDEADFEPRYLPPVRHGRMALIALALGGGAMAVAHHLGWTTLVASIGNWRAV